MAQQIEMGADPCSLEKQSYNSYDTDQSIKQSITPSMLIQKPPLTRPLIYRKLYPGISIEWLDANYGHYLISGEESWREIPRRFWFKLQNQNGVDSWWDIRQLLLQITQCLNSSNMGNSYPQFPHDPFTRYPIPYDQLDQLYLRAHELQLSVHCSTLVFLYWLHGKKIRKKDNRWKKTILNTKQLNMILCTWLRFRNINSQDSQGNFIGIWEPKRQEIDVFERNYHQYCQQPPFMFEFGTEIINPRRKILEDFLRRLPKEEWDLSMHSYPVETSPYIFYPKPQHR